MASSEGQLNLGHHNSNHSIESDPQLSRVVHSQISRWSDDLQETRPSTFALKRNEYLRRAPRLWQRLRLLDPQASRQRKRNKALTLMAMAAICVAVVITLSYMVFIPILVKAILKHSEFKVEALKLSKVTNTGFQLGLRQSLGRIPLNPRISPFPATIAERGGPPLFRIPVPQFRGSRLNIEAVDITITSSDAFTAFAKRLITLASLQITLQGHTTVSVSCTFVLNNIRCSARLCR